MHTGWVDCLFNPHNQTSSLQSIPIPTTKILSASHVFAVYFSFAPARPEFLITKAGLTTAELSVDLSSNVRVLLFAADALGCPAVFASIELPPRHDNLSAIHTTAIKQAEKYN
jgi:hypothetical protein